MLYCRIDSTFKAVELCIAVQIQNIYKRVFFTRPLLLRLDTQEGRQINDTNRNENTLWWMKLNALFFFRKLTTQRAEIELGKLAVGGFHKPKHKLTIQTGMHIFKGE